MLLRNERAKNVTSRFKYAKYQNFTSTFLLRSPRSEAPPSEAPQPGPPLPAPSRPSPPTCAPPPKKRAYAPPTPPPAKAPAPAPPALTPKADLVDRGVQAAIPEGGESQHTYFRGFLNSLRRVTPRNLMDREVNMSLTTRWAVIDWAHESRQGENTPKAILGQSPLSSVLVFA